MNLWQCLPSFKLSDEKHFNKGHAYIMATQNGQIRQIKKIDFVFSRIAQWLVKMCPVLICIPSQEEQENA